ncbi:MAG: type II toxin-antitoxin system RelB/DinJ family antitoxin [bacterium]|nr:type II toxin-antitoxin system RelB/DinJ family antitoxin [bacterium]
MTTLITIKTDSKVKAQAQKVAGELGVSLSTVINTSLKQFIRDKELYISAKPLQMSPKLERLLTKVEADLKAKKNLSPKFKSVKEMDKYLDA